MPGMPKKPAMPDSLYVYCTVILPKSTSFYSKPGRILNRFVTACPPTQTWLSPAARPKALSGTTFSFSERRLTAAPSAKVELAHRKLWQSLVTHGDCNAHRAIQTQTAGAAVTPGAAFGSRRISFSPNSLSATMPRSLQASMRRFDSIIGRD